MKTIDFFNWLAFSFTCLLLLVALAVLGLILTGFSIMIAMNILIVGVWSWGMILVAMVVAYELENSRSEEIMKIYLLCQGLESTSLIKSAVMARPLIGEVEFVNDPEIAEILIVQVPVYLGQAHGLRARFPRKCIYSADICRGGHVNLLMFTSNE